MAMAPLVLVQQAARSVYIDLTQSDDEGDKSPGITLTRQPPTQLLSTSPILPPPRRSANSRGAPQKTVDLTTRIIPKNNEYNFSFTPGLSKKASGTKVPVRPSPSTRNSPAPNGQHINKPRTNDKIIDRVNSLDLGHDAKRRKLEGGIDHGTGATRPSPSSRSSQPAVQSDLKPEPGRRGSARRASSVDYEVKHDKAVRQAIQKHVFPHILAGVAQYKGVLSSVDRNCIGKKVRTQVAEDLVKTPIFMQNFLENDFRLSSEFEQELALHAATLVKRYAKLVLEGLNIQDLEFLDPDDAGDVSIVGTASNRSHQRASSSSSNNDTEVLEVEAMTTSQRPLHQPKLHDYFESTAMSAGTDDVGHKTLEASKSTDSSGNSAVNIKTRRSTRKLKAQTHVTTTPHISVTLGTQSTSTGYPSKQARRSHNVASASTEPSYWRHEHSVDAGDPKKNHTSHHRTGRSSLTTLLREREMVGMGALNFRHGQVSFRTEAMINLEDSLARRSYWTNCSGDIATISWAGEGAFICGSIAHSDTHNMQYNKPGNLVFGSSSLDTLKSIADHRIIRPLIDPDQNKENGSHAMRQTQDPWLYTSVVSASYSETTGLTFTASFDKTVKIWAVSKDGSSMKLAGTWAHDNKVNFVVTSQVHSRVATAADVYSDAIRVYNPQIEDIGNSPYHTYSGIKAQEQADEVRAQDTWAFFPATMQWGKSRSVKDLLLVGYSPRSLTGDDADIPHEKKNMGELCIWNSEDQSKVPIFPGASQNVFEVVWHPSQPCFLAATSPSGDFDPDKTRTQVRLFVQNGVGIFRSIRALDCPAIDINELTIMPNSMFNYYATASCTDGNTYVWDTAQKQDQPIHVLNHGESLDNPLPDLPREIGDAGVKFAAWGQTYDRLYTGSSDGKVNAWDVKAVPKKAFIRTVLEVAGGISAGVFSKDYSKLLIGDATGKVHLLAVDGADAEVQTSLVDPSTVGLGARLGLAAIIPPKLVIPHAEPPMPSSPNDNPNNISTDDETGSVLAHKFLEEGHLTLYPDPLVGAVQGPNYHETSFFRAEAHEEGDISNPLKSPFRAKQRFRMPRRVEQLNLPKLPAVKCSSSIKSHLNNLKLDRDFKAEGIEFECDCALIEEWD